MIQNLNIQNFEQIENKYLKKSARKAQKIKVSGKKAIALKNLIAKKNKKTNRSD